jgi:hypothetical protein
MLTIVDEMMRQGVDPASTSLQVGVFGAEPWTDDMRRELEQRLDMHAVDIYGLSEVIGPGVAQECVETKDGLHIWEDHFYPEVVDTETGDVLPDGQRCELVFTSLTKEAMPVIRYRTRDLTRLLPGTARTMRRMEKVTGRSDDNVILRGVNLSAVPLAGVPAWPWLPRPTSLAKTLAGEAAQRGRRLNFQEPAAPTSRSKQGEREGSRGGLSGRNRYDAALLLSQLHRECEPFMGGPCRRPVMGL